MIDSPPQQKKIMRTKSVKGEAREIALAASMIELGSRLQVLQIETSLSRDRLVRLYREIRKVSPPKGLLPFSVDWYMTWLPNIHSSAFHGIYRSIIEHTPSRGADALVDSYRLYQELAKDSATESEEPVLSFTRAWMLLRYFDSGMVQLSTCKQCGGTFVTHVHSLRQDYICGLCRPPPRAGKTLARSLRGKGH